MKTMSPRQWYLQADSTFCIKSLRKAIQEEVQEMREVNAQGMRIGADAIIDDYLTTGKVDPAFEELTLAYYVRRGLNAGQGYCLEDHFSPKYVAAYKKFSDNTDNTEWQEGGGPEFRHGLPTGEWTIELT